MTGQVDKIGYEKAYKGKISKLINATSIDEYKIQFERNNSPFYLGGGTKGYVRGLSIKKIIEECLSFSCNCCSTWAESS